MFMVHQAVKVARDLVLKWGFPDEICPDACVRNIR